VGDDLAVCTIDTSVLIAALRRQEASHEAARRFVERALAGQVRLRVPTTVLVEVACAIARRAGDASLGTRLAAFLASHPQVVVVPLTEARALAAAHRGARLGLRGMDAVVVEVAAESTAPLVTLDNEVRRRAAGEVLVRAPGES
jgi:predicted nucleic acid-binding protein